MSLAGEPPLRFLVHRKPLKVLMINAGVSSSTTTIALNEISRQLNREQIETEIFHIGGMKIEECCFCNSCKITGKCVQDDILNDLLEKASKADGYIFASQSHYGVANAPLALLLHRWVTADSTCLGKPVATVITCRRSGATSALSELNSFFLMKSMLLISSTYWNILVGNTPELAQQDLEGLRTMRNLARNMAWILKNIQAGQIAGIEKPTLE